MQLSAADPQLADAFSRAYHEFAQAIFRYCAFQTFDREEGKDLMQETFTKTWEYLAAGHDVDNVKPFLYRVAGNLVINRGKANKKKKTLSLEALQEAGFDPGADAPELKRDTVALAQLTQALAKIDESSRSAVILNYIEGYSPAEIAEMSGETANVISVRLNRAIKKLRAHFPNHHEF